MGRAACEVLLLRARDVRRRGGTKNAVLAKFDLKFKFRRDSIGQREQMPTVYPTAGQAIWPGRQYTNLRGIPQAGAEESGGSMREQETRRTRQSESRGQKARSFKE
jgi:hypothetical protein